MGVARKLATLETDIYSAITKCEEVLVLVERRNGKDDDNLIEALSQTLSDLTDAHVHNTDARSFEGEYRKKNR